MPPLDTFIAIWATKTFWSGLTVLLSLWDSTWSLRNANPFRRRWWVTTMIWLRITILYRLGTRRLRSWFQITRRMWVFNAQRLSICGRSGALCSRCSRGTTPLKRTAESLFCSGYLRPSGPRLRTFWSTPLCSETSLLLTWWQSCLNGIQSSFQSWSHKLKTTSFLTLSVCSKTFSRSNQTEEFLRN